MRALVASLALAFVVTSCGGTPPASRATDRIFTEPPATSAGATATAGATAAASGPAFMTTSMTDVRTGEPFAIGAFPGKVVLVIAMAVW